MDSNSSNDDNDNVIEEELNTLETPYEEGIIKELDKEIVQAVRISDEDVSKQNAAYYKGYKNKRIISNVGNVLTTGYVFVVELATLTVFISRHTPLIDRVAKTINTIQTATESFFELKEMLKDIDIIASTQVQILEIYQIILEELNKKGREPNPSESLPNSSLDTVVVESEIEIIRKTLNLRLFGLVYAKLMFLLEVFDSLAIKEKSGDAPIKESFKNVLRALRRAYKPIDITTNLYKKLNILHGYISIQNQQLTWLVFICMTKYKDEWNQILEKLMKKQFFFDFITNSKITEEMVEGYYRGDNVNRIEDDENNFKFNIGKKIDETSSTYKVKPNIHPQATEQEANENYNKYKENLDKNKTIFSKFSSFFTSNQGTGGAKQQKKSKTRKQQKNRKQPKKQKSKKQSKTKKVIYKK